MSEEYEKLGAYQYSPPMNGEPAEVTLDGEYTQEQLIKLVQFMKAQEGKHE